MVAVTSAPHYINWNFTYSCNFSCAHCYSRSPKFPKELSVEAYSSIADQIIAAGVFAVGFGGGEPLLRADLSAIVLRLGQAGVDTHITTNGWFVDDSWIERFCEGSLGMLVVSLDSAYQECHDGIRQKFGSFERACSAAKRGALANLNVFISTVLNATNVDEIPALVALADSLGVKGINFKKFRPAGNGLVNKASLYLDKERLDSALDLIEKLKRSTALKLVVYQDSRDSQCGCGLTQLTVRPNGDVTICPYSEAVIGNVTTTPLQQLWLQSPDLISRRKGGSCCLGEKDNIWPINPYLPPEKRFGLVKIRENAYVKAREKHSIAGVDAV